MRPHARILLVEDDAAISEMYRLRLNHDGYEVVLEDDGQHALETARSGSYDVILLDLGLPGMHGLDVLRQLREEPATAEVPVVVLTNYNDEQLQQESREAGAQEYLVKASITPAQLSGWVERLATRRSFGRGKG